ncbi:hypothetical protein ACFX13_041458 [Malus domestica]
MRMEDSDAGSLRTVGPITDVAAHGTRTPEMESFSTRNKMRNPNQTSTVVIEDVDEGINSQTMVNTLCGNQELRSLATVGFDGGSRGYEVTANLSSQNFQPTNMLVINTKRLQSQEMSQQVAYYNLIHTLGLKRRANDNNRGAFHSTNKKAKKREGCSSSIRSDGQRIQ